jgi:hypothetical protein
LDDKIEEILDPHENGHPITYNHYLTDNVQKAQTQRRKKALREVLRTHLGESVLQGKEDSCNFDVTALISSLEEREEVDMDRFAANSAIDMMEAYYKVSQNHEFQGRGSCRPRGSRKLTEAQVALKNVVDNISVLAIESCLIKPLPSIFSPDAVCDLDEDLVQRIAGENAESVMERIRLKERLEVLETGIGALSRLATYSRGPSKDILRYHST